MVSGSLADGDIPRQKSGALQSARLVHTVSVCVRSLFCVTVGHREVGPGLLIPKLPGMASKSLKIQ